MLKTLFRNDGLRRFWLVSVLTVAVIDSSVIFTAGSKVEKVIPAQAIASLSHGTASLFYDPDTEALLERSDDISPVTPYVVMRERKNTQHDLNNEYWQAGLNAFHRADMQAAERNFRAVLERNEGLSSSDRAAAAFWEYRALSAAGDKKTAKYYLDTAANEPPCFYSIMARHLSGKDVIEPQIQMHMALSYATHKSSKTLYPMPNWKPVSGYQIEQALLFAIMRQESRFDPNAESSMGARGVMQLMPNTAYAMARNINVSGSIGEPSVSMALGQQYIKHLMEISSIRNNLVYMLAAYNAGPSALEKWQNSAYKGDPLLFIESIPYRPTRDYVINVISNYWVYSQLFGSANNSLTSIAQGKWPLYDGMTGQLASARTAGLD